MKEIAKLIAKAKFCIALTGAGISTESGIPDFRSKNGIWSKYDINEYAYLHSFISNPAKVWKMLKEMYLSFKNAEPNNAHYALAELEKKGYLKAVITQNIDDLHQKAGSKNVIEFHGNFKTLTCLSCRNKYRIDEIDLDNIPPKCRCNGILKPDIIFFGEGIPKEALIRSYEMANKCDVMLVIGTSCFVYPAGELPLIAKKNKAKIIEINKQESMISSVADYFLKGKAGEILPKILKEIKEMH